MRVLLIHTAGSEGSVALADTDLAQAVVATERLPGRTSSERLVPAVRRLMAERGMEAEGSGGGGGGAWAGIVYRGAGGFECGEGVERGGWCAVGCGVAAGVAGGC